LSRRTIITLLGATIALLTAAPAQAKLVYVKGPIDAPHVFVADDDGTNPHKVGDGRSPAISSDGRWVAWVSDEDNSLQQVHLRLSDLSRKARDVVRSDFVGELKFSPDSKLLGIELRNRLWAYNIHDRESVKAASGQLRGFSFSPDSASIAFGTAGHSDAFDAPSDLYAFSIADKKRRRITRDRKSLNPLWTAAGIVHDRFKRREGDAPTYNLFEIQPDGGSLRRITSLKIPPLLSGLVPLERSANGKRLIAEFEGQDTSWGMAVNPKSGKARALSPPSEHAFVATDLSADGRTVLGMTGGPDPNNKHNVATIPYRGGKPKVLVRRAMDPDWSL
jgi:Tol biopolymer transport system component